MPYHPAWPDGRPEHTEGNCRSRHHKTKKGRLKASLSFWSNVALLPVTAPHGPRHPACRRFILQMKNISFVQSERLPGHACIPVRHALADSLSCPTWQSSHQNV
ncbi:hypothetical protein DESPIG_00450 [Desulfovibrio piger ATCC 29098]|uniref:Uncharacterized protein n=1 Tax=Desulfovibrio piger ATCC 29098 TaxID=411464 RepID=B6WQX0_9BACT|nr:hypothetical protein DESPIG_00450 [Desulfovibrio piger ATCC 29098]